MLQLRKRGSTKSLFGMCDCTVDSDVGKRDFVSVWTRACAIARVSRHGLSTANGFICHGLGKPIECSSQENEFPGMDCLLLIGLQKYH